jgi:hypothetical protein
MISTLGCANGHIMCANNFVEQYSDLANANRTTSTARTLVGVVKGCEVESGIHRSANP